jgi:hypothetical protein
MCLNSLFLQWLILYFQVQPMISFNIVYRLFQQQHVDYISRKTTQETQWV